MPEAGIRMVVGLGNPGERYAGTRHNVGFLAVERFLAGSEAAEPWARPPVGEGLAARARLTDGADLRLFKPHTYMNRSGEAVAALARYFRVEASSLLVVSDDFSLPLGRLRIRAKGSSGGQKGLESVLQQMGTQEVPRLRLGIGPVPPKTDPSGFVLGRFRSEDADKVDAMVERAAQAIRAVCEGGVERAMNEFNSEGE